MKLNKLKALYRLEGLLELGVISEKPKSLMHGKYVVTKRKMKEFCESEGIPFHHLDAILWEEGSGVRGNAYPT